jgi:hypothetical protein
MATAIVGASAAAKSAAAAADMGAATAAKSTATADMAASAAKSAAATPAAATSTAAAMADEDEGAGCASGDLQIDRRGRCRRRALNGGQKKQTARQSGHSRRGYSHDKTS